MMPFHLWKHKTLPSPPTTDALRVILLFLFIVIGDEKVKV
jgi:hypothetical protein